MKLEVNREALVSKAGVAAKLTKATSTVPILSHLYLKAEGNTLSVSGTDLEAVVTFTIPADVKKDGEVCIPARTFVDLLATLTDERVSMRLTPKTLTLKMECGKNTANVKGTTGEEFPRAGVKGDLVTALDAEALTRVIKQASTAAGTDVSRPMLQGVLVKFVDKTMQMVAADGFRLARVTEPLKYTVDKDQQVLVPSHGLTQLGLQKLDADVEVWVNEGKTITFTTDDMRLDVRTLDLQFPDYNQIIPTSKKTTITLVVAEFLKGMRAAQVFARESSHTARYQITTDGTITILSRSDETGDNTSVVDCSVDGVALEIAVNCRYMMQALNALESTKAVLEFKNANSPIAMKPEDDDNVIFVIMPMQIGE